jgi:hypothetical protein
MEKDKETEIGAPSSAMEFCLSFEVGRSMFDVRRSFSMKIKSWVVIPGYWKSP